MKLRLTLLRAASVAAMAALLASCGGGTSNGLVAFVPERILVFGDQSSVITADGRKYTINAVNADDTVNCTLNHLWIQVLAGSYGKGFPECPLAAETAAPTSRILAQAGATAAGTSEIDLVQQVTRQLELPADAGGGITSSDMVTVFIGVNDVVEAFKRYELGASVDEVKAQTEAAGKAIAAQVARIADTGGRVLVSTVPDVGVTPYGRSKDLAGSALLTLLTLRVNNQFLLTLQSSGYNDGRRIGLIELNPYLISVVGNPAAYGYVNVKDAACVPPVALDCTTSTLTTDPVSGTPATATTWLWASELQLSPQGHAQLGNLASTRAHNQPF